MSGVGSADVPVAEAEAALKHSSISSDSSDADKTKNVKLKEGEQPRIKHALSIGKEKAKVNFGVVTTTVKLVVCVNGTDESVRAFWAARRAAHPGDEIHILCVMVRGGGSKAEHERLLSDSEDMVNEYVAGCRHDPQLAKVNVVGQVLVAKDAPKAVVQYLISQGAEHVFVGTRALKGLQRMLLGSFSEYIVQNAPCAVTVTKKSSVYARHGLGQ